MAEASRAVLAELDTVEPVDDVDRVTVSAMRERIGLELELHEADEFLGMLNNIASPVQELRDIFDLMPTDTPEQWENIAARLEALPGAMAGVIESLRLAASRGRVAARRQVDECVAPGRGAGRPRVLLPGLRARRGRRRGAGGHRRRGRPRFAARGWRGRGPSRLRRPGGVPARRARTAGTGAGRVRARALPAVVAVLPRRCRRPRGDLPVGPGRARPDRRRAGGGRRTDRRRGRERRAGRRRAGRRPVEQARGHRSAAGLDAADRRRGDRRAGRRALRHPRPAAHPGVQDRPDPDRRHLLHRPVGRLLPPGPDVVVGAAGRDDVQHLAREDHRLPRGRARPSPAGRAGRVPASRRSTPGAGWPAGSAATARAGRCTPSD